MRLANLNHTLIIFSPLAFFSVMEYSCTASDRSADYSKNVCRDQTGRLFFAYRSANKPIDGCYSYIYVDKYDYIYYDDIETGFHASGKIERKKNEVKWLGLKPGTQKCVFKKDGIYLDPQGGFPAIEDFFLDKDIKGDANICGDRFFKIHKNFHNNLDPEGSP